MNIEMFFYKGSIEEKSRYIKLTPYMPGVVLVECHDENGPCDSDTVFDVMLPTERVEQLIDALHLMLKVVKP